MYNAAGGRRQSPAQAAPWRAPRIHEKGRTQSPGAWTPTTAPAQKDQDPERAASLMAQACGYSCSRYPEGSTFEYRYTRDQGLAALALLAPGQDSRCLAAEIMNAESEIFCGSTNVALLGPLLEGRPDLAPVL